VSKNLYLIDTEGYKEFYEIVLRMMAGQGACYSFLEMERVDNAFSIGWLISGIAPLSAKIYKCMWSRLIKYNQLL